MSTRSGTHYYQTYSDQVYDPNPRRTYHEPVYEPNPRRSHQHDPEYNLREPHHHEYNPRYPCPDFVDQDDRAIRDIRIEVPTFDGHSNPEVYLDWERKMDQYFDWNEMSEKRKYQFAKSKLVRKAKLYWEQVEWLDRLPIVTWRDLKIRLREKYLPRSYHQRLLDQSVLPITQTQPRPPRSGLRPSLNQTLIDLKLCMNQVPIVSFTSITQLTKKDDMGDFKENESEPIEPLEDCDEEIYPAQDNLADEYEGEIEDEVTGPKEPLVITQSKESEDGNETAISQDFKENKNDDSCIKTIATDISLAPIDLVPTDRIDVPSIPIKYRCLVPIKFQIYQNNIWCDVSTIKAGSIIRLMKPYFYAQDVILRGHTCTSVNLDKKLTLYPSPPQMTKDPICMIVYKPSEKDHFYPNTYSATHVDHLNFVEIIRLYTIGFNKCVRFISYFHKTLWHLLGTQHRFTATYLKLCAKVFRAI